MNSGIKLLPVFASALAFGATSVSASASEASATHVDVANGLRAALSIERDVPQYSSIFASFALNYAFQIKQARDSVSGWDGVSLATVACSQGGSILLSGSIGVFQAINADFRDCTTSESGVANTSNGVVSLTLTRALPFLREKLVAAKFGVAGDDFIETRQFDPAPPDALAPTRLAMNFILWGDLPTTDARGVRDSSNYRYVMNGSFYEENHYYVGSGGETTHTLLIDSKQLVVAGSYEVVSGEVSSVTAKDRYVSGELAHEIFEPESEAPNRVRRTWTFDNLTLFSSENYFNGERKHGFQGKVRMAAPQNGPTRCQGGEYTFATPRVIVETGPGNQEYVAGNFRLEGVGSVSFTDSYPGVVSRVPGLQPMTFDVSASFLGYGDCDY